MRIPLINCGPVVHCGEKTFLGVVLINNFPKPLLMMIETTVNNFMIRMETNKCLLDSPWLATEQC